MDAGTIVIKTNVDTDQASKDLAQLNRKVQKLEDQLNKNRGKQSSISEDLEQAEAAASKTRQEIAKMQAEYNKLSANPINANDYAGNEAAMWQAMDERAAKMRQISESINEQKAKLSDQNAELWKIRGNYESITDQIAEEETTLESMNAQAGSLGEQMIYAATDTNVMSKAVARADAVMDKFTKRVKGLAKRVFVFTLITAALRGVRNWMGSMIKTNDEAVVALSRLKGALLTLAQPTLEVVIPAFAALVNILAKIVTVAAQLMARLFGKSLKQTSAAAKAMNAEKDAIEGVGGAAAEAAKNLSGLDEVNTWDNGSDGGGGAGSGGSELGPDFDLSSMGIAEDKLSGILTLVTAIGTALLAWRIGKALGLGLENSIALFAVLFGGIEFVKNIFDAWANGVSWNTLLQMVAALSIAVLGLNVLFGASAAGIGLVVGGLAMLVTGFHDAIESGWNLENTLTAVAGIVATGLGITLLTGSLIPALVAGVLGLLVAITTLTGNGTQLITNLKQVFSGLVQFVKGVLSGDWKFAWEGMKNTLKGIFNTMATLFGSVVNLIIRGLNWLISKMNQISFSVPSWVPGIGGRSLGVNIRPIQEYKIPQLATGAVIPPNREFVAVLGDQKQGTNIETPENLLRQIMREELGKRGGNSYSVNATANGRVLFRVIIDEAKQEKTRTGRNPFDLT